MDTYRLLDATEERELDAKRHSDAVRAQPKIQKLHAREALLRTKNPKLPQWEPSPPPGALPSRFSWEDLGKVSPIKNQNPAGTCWTFADLSQVESQLLIRDGVEVDLAEQDLIDCGRSGAIARMEIGISYEAENPYQKKPAPTDPTPACKTNRTPFYVDGLVFLEKADPNKFPLDPVATPLIKKAIYEHGGAVVNMHIPTGSGFSAVSGKTPFMETIPLLYNGYPKPTDKRNNGSHIVDIVGWDDSLNAWRIKNSWGTGWGDKGFGYITYGSNRIGMGAAYFELGSPDVLISAVWEKSNAEELSIQAWPHAYFQSRYDDLWEKGWRIYQLATTVAEGQILYSAIWRKGTDGEVQHYGLTYSELKAKYDELWKDGWRIHLLDSYVVADTIYYSTVLRKTGGAEVQHFEQPYEQFQKEYDDLWKQGWRLEILNNPIVAGQVRYTGVWRKGNDAEVQHYGQKYADFQKTYDTLWKDGWRIHLLRNYRIDNEIFFNATWRKGQAGEVQWYGLSVDGFGPKRQELAKSGWRIRLLDTY
jgi:hypothetical protein